jgi:hypothetical protein
MIENMEDFNKTILISDEKNELVVDGVCARAIVIVYVCVRAYLHGQIASFGIEFIRDRRDDLRLFR